MNVLSWNIGRGLCQKLQDSEFVDFILKYDIIALYECWISPEDVVHLDGYESFLFPRRYGKGGGIVIFCKQDIAKHVHIVDNFFDSIIWMKLQPSNLISKPVFIAFSYLPPENSIFYTRNDIDLFQSIEDSVSNYKKQGYVYIAGDLNARCGDRNDFIDDIMLSRNISNLLQPLINYDSDEIMNRKSMDISVNQFGRKLISLCKTTGLRIVNGRHHEDPNGSITFFGPNGMSLIDYLLTESSHFKNILNFSSGIFTTFSDHAPVYFKLSIPNLDDKSEVHDLVIDQGRTDCKSVKWIEENTESIYNSVLERLNDMYNVLNCNIDSEDDLNVCVDQFSDMLTSIVLPHCQVNVLKLNRNNRPVKRIVNVDKPWFNNACKLRYSPDQSKVKRRPGEILKSKCEISLSIRYLIFESY